MNIINKLEGGIEMHLMSFYHTKEQIRDQTKTVTRRLGWGFLQPGDLVWAVERARGLKKEAIKRLAILEIVSVQREPLAAIDPDECMKEGFPEKEPEDLIRLICKINKQPVSAGLFVNRIQFRYV